MSVDAAFLVAVFAITVSFIVIASSNSSSRRRVRQREESPSPAPRTTRTPSSHFPNPTPPYTPTPTTHMASSGRFDEARRSELKRIADETIAAIKQGFYPFRGVDQELRTKEAVQHTKYYEPESPVSLWASTTPDPPAAAATAGPTHISVLNISTLDAARLLEHAYKTNPLEQSARTGVLNFASATKPGGGFKNGAEAQEESIARASTLYATLKSDAAARFYKLHKAESAQNAGAYYSHAIVYSPEVTVFRDDDGAWTYPFAVDVLSCAAVNAGELKKAHNGPISAGLDVFVEKEMAERMGRILYVFEQHGIRNIVLGTFGTGVFRNSVATVARIWAQLLILPDARFKYSFDRIIFAITGGETFADFQSAFDAWGQHRAPGLGAPRGTQTVG